MNRKLKILITTDLFHVETNGVVTSTRNLADELRTRGHEVRILAVSGDKTSKREGDVYYVRSVPFKVYPGVRMPLSDDNEYVKELIEWKPDIIHSQCEFFSLNFGKKIAKRTGAPIVHTYHTLYEEYTHYVVPGRRLGDFVVWFLSRTLLKKVSGIIAPTPKIEARIKTYGLKTPISVIPSGISLNQHKQRISEAERLEKRRELNVSDDTTLLMNLGRLGKEKNIDELLHYCSRLFGELDGVKLMIVGDGPDRAELEGLAKSLSFGDKIIFTGKIAPADVHKYYQLGDVFINASVSETQGLTYIEAAANGLPLVCRNDPCLDGVIYNGENGYAYNNEYEFKTYIKHYASDKAARERDGKNGEKIVSKFDKAIFGEAVEKLYYDTIGDKK